MTTKGRLRELESQDNYAVVKFDHGKDAEVEYRGEMQKIAKKPRCWNVTALVLLGAESINPENALSGRWLHHESYTVDKSSLAQAANSVKESIIEDLGKVKTTYAISLKIKVRIK